MKCENSAVVRDIEHRDVLKELRDVQEVYGFLPRREIARIAEELDVPVLDVYAQARSEPGLRVQPVLVHKVSVCFGSPWHACASPEILAAFRRAFGSVNGVPQNGSRAIVETFKCPGPCSGRPHVMVDGREVACATVADVRRIVEELNMR